MSLSQALNQFAQNLGRYLMASLPWLLAVHERFGSQTLQAVKNTCFWWYSMNSCEGGFEEGNVI